MYIIFIVRFFSKIGFTQSEIQNSTDSDCLPIRQKSAQIPIIGQSLVTFIFGESIKMSKLL
jgi:hypothetical protein